MSNDNSINKKMLKENDDSSESRSDFFRKAIPIMPKPLAVICCIFNIIFPGLGTLVSSFSIFFCASHKYEKNLKAFFINILAFLLQLCSAVIIFGWVWSIKYGLLFIQLSNKTEDSSTESDLPLYIRRHSSLDANLIYNAKPRLSAIALARVKEEDS